MNPSGSDRSRGPGPGRPRPGGSRPGSSRTGGSGAGGSRSGSSRPGSSRPGPSRPGVRGLRTPATAGVLRAGEDRREPSRRKPKVTKSTPAIEAVGSRLTRDLSRAVPNRPGSAAGAEAQNRELRILAIGPLETGVLIVPVRDGRILAARILGRRVRTKAIPALLMDAVSVSEAQRAQNLGRQVPVPESPIQTVRATLPREVPTERPGGFLSTTE
jgi:hypothetical protein